MPLNINEKQRLLEFFSKTNEESPQFDKLPEAGSSKRLYRVKGKSSGIIMTLTEKPNNRGGMEEWAKCQKELRKAGIETPEILASFLEKSTLIIQDCGDTSLTEKLNNLKQTEEQNSQEIYLNVLKVLQKIQKVPPSCSKLVLGEEELNTDFCFFMKEHIAPREKTLGNIWDKKLFLKEAHSMSKFIASQAIVLTHRDFHSGNFLYLNKDTLKLIDFQDACQGNYLYDFVSFFLDPYIEINPQERQKKFYYYLSLFKENFPSESQKRDIDSLCKPQVIQRVYKILGSFNFLGKQKGKEKYLSYIDPVLEYLDCFSLFDERWPYLTKTLKEALCHGK